MCVGAVCESTLMSVGDRVCGMKACNDGQVNSPDLIKAKKPRQYAAHNIVVSNVLGSWDHLP